MNPALSYQKPVDGSGQTAFQKELAELMAKQNKDQYKE